MSITLQEAYNMLSILGFSICMYKIYKLESAMTQVTTNQLINTLSTYIITKKLKENGILEDIDTEIKIGQNE